MHNAYVGGWRWNTREALLEGGCVGGIPEMHFGLDGGGIGGIPEMHLGSEGGGVGGIP
jgi:hypothetical protein